MKRIMTEVEVTDLHMHFHVDTQTIYVVGYKLDNHKDFIYLGPIPDQIVPIEPIDMLEALREILDEEETKVRADFQIALEKVEKRRAMLLALSDESAEPEEPEEPKEWENL